MEEWKIGWMDEWKGGDMRVQTYSLILPLFHSSILPFPIALMYVQVYVHIQK
jgi:hypothetical protein